MQHFQCPASFGDARVEELKLLAAADRDPDGLVIEPAPTGPWKDLLLFLISNDLATSFSYEYLRRLVYRPDELVIGAGVPGETRLEREIVKARVEAINAIHRGERKAVRMTHAGRVRLSELKQALRSGREREPFRILWDGRHWERDLQVAMLDAGTGTPVSVAYCDMNGLKQINDSAGHDAGDVALRTYFESVASTVADRGDAYRLGGDEVLVVLRDCSEGDALKLMRLACNKLMGEVLVSGGALAASISAGLVVSTDPAASPAAVRSKADQAQYRAKARSRNDNPRPSVIAVDTRDELTVIPHPSAS